MALIAPILHGSEMRRAKREHMNGDRSEIDGMLNQIAQLRETGTVSEGGAAALRTIVALIGDREESLSERSRQVTRIWTRLVDERDDPVAAAVAGVAQNSLEFIMEDGSLNGAVAGADVGGALGGANLGKSFGIWGAVGGAILGGAAASVAVAW